MNALQMTSYFCCLIHHSLDRQRNDEFQCNKKELVAIEMENVEE